MLCLQRLELSGVFFFFNQLTLALRWVVMISSYQILDLSGG